MGAGGHFVCASVGRLLGIRWVSVGRPLDGCVKVLCAVCVPWASFGRPLGARWVGAEKCFVRCASAGRPVGAP